MGKSGQTSTKADTGGQRVPQHASDDKRTDKKQPPKTVPSKKVSGPKKDA